MSNRRKTREERLQQLARSNPRKRARAKEELERIAILKKFAWLDDRHREREAESGK